MKETGVFELKISICRTDRAVKAILITLVTIYNTS